VLNRSPSKFISSGTGKRHFLKNQLDVSATQTRDRHNPSWRRQKSCRPKLRVAEANKLAVITLA
jgi:hypothetical protein